MNPRGQHMGSVDMKPEAPERKIKRKMMNGQEIMVRGLKLLLAEQVYPSKAGLNAEGMSLGSIRGLHPTALLTTSAQARLGWDRLGTTPKARFEV